jgi:hypothetical protein
VFFAFIPVEWHLDWVPELLWIFVCVENQSQDARRSQSNGKPGTKDGNLSYSTFNPIPMGCTSGMQAILAWVFRCAV